MRTLVLAEQPFRTLRSRAILGDLARRLPKGPPLLVATAAERCPPGFVAVPLDPDPARLGVGRVVITGIFQEPPELERVLRIAGRALAAGARLEARSFSVERALDRSVAQRKAPDGIAVLDHAAPLEVREHATANALLVWRVAAPITLLPYPEREVELDPALAEGLPGGPLLGLGILGDAETRRAVGRQAGHLHALLAPVRDWQVVPLPAEASGSATDDLPGTLDFARALLPGAPCLLLGLADPAWRRRQLSPARLKGLAGRCALVVTNQDLVAASAIAAGVKVLGLWLGPDRRIASCLTTLANDLPDGTRLLRPPAG